MDEKIICGGKIGEKLSKYVISSLKDREFNSENKNKSKESLNYMVCYLVSLECKYCNEYQSGRHF